VPLRERQSRPKFPTYLFGHNSCADKRAFLLPYNFETSFLPFVAFKRPEKNTSGSPEHHGLFGYGKEGDAGTLD
jgi:hypothetical protein